MIGTSLITQLGHALRTGKTSCVELAQDAIAGLKNDTTRAVITILEERALDEAIDRDRELAAGIDRGPFHGIPTVYKDIFYTRGVRTTGGSLVFKDFVPKFDATVVSRLKMGGAVTVGKANLHELAYGATSKNPHYGFVLHPHDPARVPGGSSGGSAALVANGVVPMSLGSDTGGSIRIPASYCGVVGLKPTYGRVSRYGVLPLSFGLDHVGPLGASVEDCALTMNVIAGSDIHDESCARLETQEFNLPPLPTLAGLRVGLPSSFYFDAVDDEVAAAVKNSLREMERLGAVVEEIDIPDLHKANIVARIIQLSEAASLYTHYSDSSLFGADTWELIQQGKAVKAHEYVNAQRLREVFRREFDDVWQRVDILVAPSTPIAAPLIDETTVWINGKEEDVRMASTRLARPMNFLGEPALSMPCGKTKSGLPIGLQLISPPFTEPELLQVARTLEGRL